MLLLEILKPGFSEMQFGALLGKNLRKKIITKNDRENSMYLFGINCLLTLKSWSRQAYKNSAKSKSC